MYVCVNCGTKAEELYRRYCPSVLKLLKCENCNELVDKYIEYDPVIVLVDLILIKKTAYRHLLYNSDFKSYWKLMVVLWLARSFTSYSACERKAKETAVLQFDNAGSSGISGECNFYITLIHTAVCLGGFLCTTIILTEFMWLITRNKPEKYNIKNLCQALIIGGCATLLRLLDVIWGYVALTPHNILVQGYTISCLITSYSVVCNTTKCKSLIALAGGFIVYIYLLNIVPTLHSSILNIITL